MAPLPPNDFNPHIVYQSLTFFAAYLFELDSIKTYATIRNYMTHVKQFYIKKGYPKKLLESPAIAVDPTWHKKMHSSKS